MTHGAREKPSSGPQGARPKSRKNNSISTDLNPNTSIGANEASKVPPPPPRLARALPIVPPASSGTHMLSSPPRGAIRPLPFCPPVSTLSNHRLSSSSQASSSTPSLPTLSLTTSSATSSASSSPSIEPSTIQFIFSSTPMSIVGDQETSSFASSPIVFVCPEGDSDSDCSDEDEDDEAADTVEPYTFRLASYKKITASNWMPKWISYRPDVHPPMTKWVTEKKGQRITVEDHDNVIHILRTL